MVAVQLTGGNFSRGVFEGWMKDDRTMIGCCTDGVRPVIFRIERIEDGYPPFPGGNQAR